MVGVNGVVTGLNRDGAAQNREIVVRIDAVIGRGDVKRHAVDDQAGVVTGLDAVLGVAVDGQRAIACQVDLRVGLGLERGTVESVCDGLIGGILVGRVLVIG